MIISKAISYIYLLIQTLLNFSEWIRQYAMHKVWWKFICLLLLNEPVSMLEMMFLSVIADGYSIPVSHV